MRKDDPVEKIIAGALDITGITYLREINGLDFYLPWSDVSIEVKQFHSARISKQMARAENVIAIQGRGAAELFAQIIVSALRVGAPVFRKDAR
jgi:hypothetical protein